MVQKDCLNSVVVEGGKEGKAVDAMRVDDVSVNSHAFFRTMPTRDHLIPSVVIPSAEILPP